MWYFWESDVIFSKSQLRLGTRKINGGRKFSEIKVQTPRVLTFVTDWNLARSLGKTYCVRKYKKVDIAKLIIVALWGFFRLSAHFWVIEIIITIIVTVNLYLRYVHYHHSGPETIRKNNYLLKGMEIKLFHVVYQ